MLATAQIYQFFNKKNILKEFFYQQHKKIHKFPQEHSIDTKTDKHKKKSINLENKKLSLTLPLISNTGCLNTMG